MISECVLYLSFVRPICYCYNSDSSTKVRNYRQAFFSPLGVCFHCAIDYWNIKNVWPQTYSLDRREDVSFSHQGLPFTALIK